MAGAGTLCDMAGIVAGGMAGLAFSRFFTESMRRLMLTVSGLALFLMGLTGVLQEMLTIENGRLSSQGTLTIIISLSAGALVGCAADLDGRIKKLASWLCRKTCKGNMENFSNGFIKATLVVCIGAMAIMGPLQERFYADHTLLLVKSVIDFVSIMALTIPYGKGCLFAALPVGLCQGSITAAAGWIQPAMTAHMLSNISLVGSVIILATGINLVWDKDIPVINLIPAIPAAMLLALLIP